MSLYVPSGVASGDLDVAQSPYFGGEFGVYLTTKPGILAATIEAIGAGIASLTLTPGVSLPGGGTHLQVAALTPVTGFAHVTVDGSGHDTGGAVNFTGDFALPSRVDQGPHFERGFATDLGSDGDPSGFVGLDAGASNAGFTGAQDGAQFGVYQLPLLSDYTFVGCTTEIDFNTKSRMAKGVDCGMESDAFVKRGKTQPGQLSIGSKMKGFAEGLARFDGLKCTCLLVGLKDGQLIGDRIVFTQYVPTIKPKLPEGDGEAMMAGEGKFVEQLYFVAP